MPDRRRFMRLLAGVTGVGAFLLTAFPMLRAFSSPLFRTSRKANWIRLGEVDAIEPGVPSKVDFVQTMSDAWVETRALRNVWVYTEDNEHFTVYNGRCTHLGCSYGYDAQQGVFRCPCHQGVFDVKTGAVLGGPPPRPLDQLEVRIDDGLLYAEIRDYRLGIPGKISA